MGRSTTPTFVTEFELQMTPKKAKTLHVRLDCARQVYNAVLTEALKRADKLKGSEEYGVARAMPRTINGEPNKERGKAFGEARKLYEFGKYDLASFAGRWKQTWLGAHLDANTLQVLGERAYKAVNDYLLGVHGRPRFKGKGRMRSVQGKSNKQGIRFVGNAIEWASGKDRKTRLRLPLIVKPRDPVHQHGLLSPVKYCRLLRRPIRGRERWFVQLVGEGLPFVKPKNKAGDAIVGLDIGPQTVAVTSWQAQFAALWVFCSEIGDKARKIAKYQQQMSRSDRANNPQNFEPDRWMKKDKHWTRKKGPVKKGRHRWDHSKRREMARQGKAEEERKLAAHRKSLHGRMVNEILAVGSAIKIEKLSYKAFQKRFGRSISNRAPGMFVEMLRRKAARAGGGVIEFPTQTTKLSQTCICGRVEKKRLSDRWHNCPCGVVVQRDLFSSFLAECVEGNQLIAGLAGERWPQVDSLLRAAVSEYESATSGHLPTSLGLDSGQSRSLVQPKESETAKTRVQLEFPFVA